MLCKKRCFGQIIQIRGHSCEQAEKNLWSRVCKPADISWSSNCLQIFIMSLEVTFCYKNEKNELFQNFSACCFCPAVNFLLLYASFQVQSWLRFHASFFLLKVELISFVHNIVNHLLDGTNFLFRGNLFISSGLWRGLFVSKIFKVLPSLQWQCSQIVREKQRSNGGSLEAVIGI